MLASVQGNVTRKLLPINAPRVRTLAGIASARVFELAGKRAPTTKIRDTMDNIERLNSDMSLQCADARRSLQSSTDIYVNFTA